MADQVQASAVLVQVEYVPPVGVHASEVIVQVEYSETVEEYEWTATGGSVGGGSASEINPNFLEVIAAGGSIGGGSASVFDSEDTSGSPRYGRGTQLNPDVSAVRSGSTLILTAKTAGLAGNSLTLTTDGAHLHDSNFSGGSNATIGSVSGGELSRIYKRTSADFTTWSAESEIVASNLSSANKKRNPSLNIDPNGLLWLFFDRVDVYDPVSGKECRNIYYQTSSDNGTTWSTAVQRTNYSTLSMYATHPVAFNVNDLRMRMMYNRVAASLLIAEGVVTAPPVYDSVNGLIYVTISNHQVDVYDATTLELTNSWTESTSPGFLYNSIHNSSRVSVNSQFSSLKYIVVHDGNGKQVSVLMPDTDNIQSYIFEANTTNGWVKNMVWGGSPADLGHFISMKVDETNDRLYIAFDATGFASPHSYIGYIDLTDTGTLNEETGIVEFTFTLIVNNAPHSFKSTKFYIDDGYIICNEFDEFNSRMLGFKVYDLSTGLKLFDLTDVTGISYYSGSTWEYVDGNIYFGFVYYSGVGYQDQRGLGRVELVSNQWSYYQPTWASTNEYYIYDVCRGPDNTLLVAHGGGLNCISMFSLIDHSWVIYNEANIPGLGGDNACSMVSYDDTDRLVFVYQGSQLVMFSIDGIFEQSYYQHANYSGGSWSWILMGVMIQRLTDHDAVAVVPENDLTGVGSYTFWNYTRPRTSQEVVYWDMESSGYNLSSFLLRSKEISIERTIDGTPNTLNFACANGHLFDPYNIASLLSPILKKGRMLTVRWGERVGGTDYWQNAGTFYVTSIKVKYKKGVYTDITVKAEDERIFWKDHNLVATEHYVDYPEDIIADILETTCDLVAADIELPTLENRTELTQQWLDMTVEEVINQILNRYGYTLKLTVDGTVSAIRINEFNAVNHTYDDLSAIIEYSPDDDYSDFTNRVLVVGYEKTYSDVYYPEEMVYQKNGTVGWWGCKKEHKVPYSNDYTRTCINPRLVVRETTVSIAFEVMGSVEEYISDVDTDNKWCEVTIYVPNLIGLLLSLIASVVASTYLPDWTVGYGSGRTIRIGTAITNTLLAAALMVLGSVANYQYEIWAVPVGHIRRSVQATADDEANQEELGLVHETKIDEPLAYTVAECQFVANQELMVARLQRKRVRVTKIAHLADEEGDMIVVNHPYSGQPVQLLITNLIRRYKVSEGQAGDGYFLDDLEGWVIEV